MRSLTSIAIGCLLAAAVLRASACFVDPNPPDPHGDAGRADQLLTVDGGDGGGAEAGR